MRRARNGVPSPRERVRYTLRRRCFPCPRARERRPIRVPAVARPGFRAHMRERAPLRCRFIQCPTPPVTSKLPAVSKSKRTGGQGTPATVALTQAKVDFTLHPYEHDADAQAYGEIG